MKRTFLMYAVPVLMAGSMSMTTWAGGDEHHQHTSKKKTMKGQEQASAKQLKGKIKQNKQAQLKGSTETNEVILLETEQGDRIAVDLGSSVNLKKVQLKQGTPVTVEGTVVNISGKPYFFATSAQIGTGEKQQIQRKGKMGQMGQKQQQSAGQMKQMSFSGKVSKLRNVNLKGSDQQHTVAVLDAKNGKQVYLDLGPSDELAQLDLSKGDSISVKGSGVRSQGRALLVVDQIKMGGQTHMIDREGVPTGEQKGDKGIKGDPGDKGEPGSKGDQGSEGIKGSEDKEGMKGGDEGPRNE